MPKVGRPNQARNLPVNHRYETYLPKATARWYMDLEELENFGVARLSKKVACDVKAHQNSQDDAVVVGVPMVVVILMHPGNGHLRLIFSVEEFLTRFISTVGI
jgi:hypothetical protein